MTSCRNKTKTKKKSWRQSRQHALSPFSVLDINRRQRIHGNKVGKAGVHDTVVRRKFEESLNPGTRITKKGFERAAPRKGRSNGKGEIRTGWDITERIEELLSKKIYYLSTKLSSGLPRHNLSMCEVLFSVPVLDLVALLTRERVLYP